MFDSVSRILRLAFALSALATPALAAKVVRLYNPWLSYGSVTTGKIHLVNYYPLTDFGPQATGNVFQGSSGPWLELTLPTLPAGVVNFTVVVDPGNVAPYYQSYGLNGIGGGDMDLGSLLATSDTVWISPSPLPNGAAKLSTKPPKSVTIMLWNPWNADTGLRVPSVRVEGGQWAKMDSVASDPGWYSSFALGFTSLDLLFRNRDSSAFFGTLGTSPLPVSTILDSLVGKNDTLWIWNSPEPAGKPRAAATHPRSRTVMLYNPWRGTIPVQRPRIVFGTQELPMTIDPVYCGWYRFQYLDRTPSATFKNSKTGQILGSTGFGAATAIDFAAASAASDTVWITTDATTGAPSVRSAYTGEIGMCEISLLAATIRDFNSDDSSFNHAGGCGSTGYVKPTLGTGRKPLPTLKIDKNCNPGDSARMANEWFTTDNTYTHSATTCIDIPLQLDSAGNYAYNNQLFFPIDTFLTLPNGKANPFNVQAGGEDNKPHNFNFCMEMHGNFDYKTGQDFHFRGDDDVYFFINNRLVVDLGGVHGPEKGSVDLDTLGLTVGQSYPWDLFFCERHTTGSDILITTSMNLRNLPAFQIVDTLLSATKFGFSLFVSQTVGQGCNQHNSLQKTVGRFTLSGPSATPPITFSPGSYFGGIVIDPTLTSGSIDTNAMTGLAPGTYAFRILPAAGDTTGARTITFTVPLLARPEFLVKTPYSGIVGSQLPVSVVSRANGRIDSNSVAFHLPAIAGISYFRDSLSKSPILPTDTLMTGKGGKARRIWVRGDAAGTYTLRTSLSGTDTVDTYPGIVFTLRGLRYVDSLGNPIDPTAGLERDVRSTVRIWLEATAGSSVCATCTDTVLLDGSKGLVFRSTAGGPSISTVRLAAGKTSFWVTGTLPLEGGQILSTLRDSSAAAILAPVAFRAPVLSWLDSSGTAIPSAELDVAIPRKLKLRASAAIDTCISCDREVSLPAIPGIAYSATPGGPPISSVTLSGRTAVVWVTSHTLAPATLSAKSDSLWDSAYLPVASKGLQLKFVDSADADIDQITTEVLSTKSVFLAAYSRSGLCASCDARVALSSIDTAVFFRSSTTGASIQWVDLVGGRAKLLVGASLTIPSGSLVRATADSLFASDSFRLVARSRVPDSAYWTDQDGDGSADQLDVFFAHPWLEISSMAAWWPSATSTVSFASARLALSSDSLHGTWTFKGGIAPLTTSGTGSRGVLSWDGRSDLHFPIADRVAPVPLSAELRYGTVTDSVLIPWSETVAAGYETWQEMVRQKSASGTWIGAKPLAVLRDPAKGRLVLLYASGDATEPGPGDSLRFSPSGALKDTLGNVPGAIARAVVLRGTDRGPLQAVMLDSDGDGRADRVVLRFHAPLLVTRRFALRWSGASGLETRIVDISQAKTDSVGRILTFDVAPFPYGRTACPAAGCADLGSMQSIWDTDTSTLSFPILDGVAPVLLDAELRFATTDALPDTLRAVFSEPVTGSDKTNSDWLSSGKLSNSATGTAIPWVGALGTKVLGMDATHATFLVDSSWHLAKSDSVRVSPASRGTVRDTEVVGADSIAPWIPLRLGPHPILLDISAHPPVRRYEGWTVPSNEPTFQIFVRVPGGNWQVLGPGGTGPSGSPLQDTSHYSGVVLRLNRAMTGGAYIYDNLGVSVANLDLARLADAVQAGLVETDRRGNYEALLAWNGVAEMKVAASGVYLVRVVTHYLEAGQLVWSNQVFKIGWSRKAD